MPTQTTSFAVSQLVAGLRSNADHLRARASIVASGAQVLRWQSAASRAFHHHLDALLARLIACATEFDRAADAVLRLAALPR